MATALSPLGGALQNTETGLHDFVIATFDVVYRMNADWSVVHKMDGRGAFATTAQASPAWLGSCTLPEDQPAIRAAIQRAILTGTVFELEHQVRDEDGALGWMLSRAVPICDETGRVEEWIGTVTDVTARRQAEDRLRDSEERLRLFAEASTDLLWIGDARRERLDYLSPAFESMFGIPRESGMAGAARMVTMVHSEDRAEFLSVRPRALAGRTVVARYRVVRPDRSTVFVRETAFPVHAADGAIVQIGGIVQDVSDIEATHAALEAEKERFRTLVEGVPQLVWRSRQNGDWSWASTQWMEFTGQSQAESCGLGWLDAVHPDDVEQTRAAWSAADALGALDVEFRVRRARTDTFLWHRTRAVPLHDGQGGFVEWLGTTTDIQKLKELQQEQQLLLAQLLAQASSLAGEISERKLVEGRLLHATQHDDLTGLCSRVFLMDRLELQLDGEAGQAGRGGLLFLDLDRFKLVNDSLGHQAGDLLLIEVGRRLRTCAGLHDTVARLGGDEFAVLINHGEPGDGVAVAERIIEAMRRPVQIGGQEIFTSCSVGMVGIGAGPVSAEEVLRDADIAMYHAKRRRDGGYAVFAETMRAGIVDALDLRTGLCNALARGELRLHYQPIHDIAARTIVGIEALLRWEHPDRGLMQPAAFIPLAEESGLVREIGRWVLREACGQLRRWCDARPGLALYLNVNASAVELNDPGYAADLRDILHETGVDPRRLQIEVTESIFLYQPDVVSRILEGIRALGVRVALDDFGTGYSSLSYLDRYPVDTIKIDGSFVAGLALRPNVAAIVRAMVELGRAMQLSVVAEGVENDAQLEMLRSMGCSLVQGYLFGRPLYAAETAALLDREPTAGAV